LTEGVINAIPDLMFELDRDGRYLNIWAQTPELLAAQKEVLLGKTIAEVLSPAAVEVCLSAIHEADEKGLSIGKVIRIELPHGESWFELSVSKKPGSDALGGRFIALSRDITGRMRAEAEMRRLTEMLEESVDFVGTADLQGRLTYHNRAARRMVGLPDDADLAGLRIADMHPEWAVKQIEEVALPAVQAQGVWRGESALLHRDGREIPVSLLLMLHRDAAGTPIFTSAIMQDITESKAAEAAREAALAEAMRLAQIRGSFLSQMSHELRTPLNGILGFTQLLQRDGAMTEEKKSWLNTIRQSGDHLLALINQILDFSKIEADKLELNSGDIQLEAFLATIVDIFGPKMKQKKLAFVCDMDAELPGVVRGDELRLRQVLLNLLGNAVKFTDQGQVTLRMSFTAPALMRFEVQDSGIGIDAGQLEAIFRPFEQVGETSRFAQGTGLGLAISRRLVQLMGGDIEVESQLGKGSLFAFELVMEVVQAEPVAADALRDQAAQSLPVPDEPLPFAPPRHEVEILHDLARRGNMRSIIQRAAYLSELDERYWHFADQLREMAKAYQSKAIVDFVGQYLKRISNT
jgi:PAS domain S-box-containing protein